MVKNMGLTDRLVRMAVAAPIAAILVVPSIIGTCLIYIPFKLDSREKRQDRNAFN